MKLNDANIKFRHLLCFLEVTKHNSVTKAAASMNLAQSAVSRSIAELETIVGSKLLERNRHGSTLTRSGQVFYQYAAPGVSQIRQAYRAASPTFDEAESIVIGILPEAVSQLPEILTSMRNRAPRVNLRVLHGTNVGHLQHLRQGDLSMVFGRIAASDLLSGLAFEHLYFETVFCVVRKGHPLAEAEAIFPSDLAQMKLVLHQPNTIIRSEVDRYLFAQGVSELADSIETDSMALARRLTLDDDRIWIAPKGAVSRDLAEGNMAELPVTGWEINASVGVTTNPKRDLTSSENDLISIIRDVTTRP